MYINNIFRSDNNNNKNIINQKIWNDLLLYIYSKFLKLIPHNMIDLSITTSLLLLNTSSNKESQESYSEYITEKSVYITSQV